MLSTVGIHIIMKDESEVLDACLTSIKDADEIIVIDTGSEDASVSIAKSYGAKVFVSQWEDDFSKPRNQALQHATTDWICYLDADEVLLSGIAGIKELVDGTQAEAFTAIIENLTGAGPFDLLLHRSVRLFRNNPGYRFQGVIHEEIEPSIVNLHPRNSITDSDIRIQHFGYLLEILQKKNKIIRNGQLLKKALQDEPANPFYAYNLGITYCQAGKLKEAKELMLLALALVHDHAPYRPTLVKDLCKILIESGEIKQAEMILLKEAERYKDYADLHYILGQTLTMQGLWERAFEQFHNAIAFQSNKYVTEAGVSTYLAYHQLAEISRNLEKPEEAARLFNHALQYNKSYAPALLGIAGVFHELHVPFDEIAVFLRNKINPSTAAEYLLLIQILEQLGAYEMAVANTPKSMLSEMPVLLVYCRSLIRLGKLEEADLALRDNLNARPGTAESGPLFQWRAICQWQLYGRLQADLQASLPSELAAAYLAIDGCFRNEKDGLETITRFDSCQELAYSVASSSIELGQLDIVTKLTKVTKPYKMALSKKLYVHGYTSQSAELFLELLNDKQLDDEGLFYLGEIVFDKGHFLQAAELFESILPSDPKHEASKAAASVCYLHLAETSILEAIACIPDASELKEDLRQIRSSIGLLNRTRWHTKRIAGQKEGTGGR